MSQLTKEEATKKLAELVAAAYAAVNEATAFADEHKLSFHFEITYGMGGTYDGDVENRYLPDYVYSADEHHGWYPCSQSC